LVLDCADSLAISYILSDACMAQNIPLVSASVLQQQGYAGAFCGGAPSYRAVFPQLPATAAQCASAGVLGTAVAVLGGMQAHMAVQVLLQTAPNPLGTLMRVQLATWHMQRINFITAPEPVIWWRFLAHSQITPHDRVIDVINTSVDNLPPSDARTILCCRSGIRAFAAAQKLHSAGHKNLYLLASVAA
jgi:sulfur-carrier protein adenylyltransferase/sulfurtransferase